MFRSRKKKDAKEATEGASRASSDIEHTPNVKSSKTFRLGKKKEEPEPKVELDLENALPPLDDFRTSLLMNGLSARFSMLREQDDPTSKIGKASDDSVLFPNRASKLIDFGFQGHGLSDIAEVSSIHGSVRPPFTFSKVDAYADGYGTDDESVHTGSIMSRPKPSEGNVLFGGRQKIYKIPAGSKSSGDGGLGGRVLYDNDVSPSAFQKLRQKEKEQQWDERNDDEDNNADISTAEHSRAGSPPLTGYNRNRETSSTTSSGPVNTRISTAATSFTSQRTPSLSGSHTPVSAGGSGTNSSMERSTPKMRRLYETGLDQHVHDQQHSSMNRIDSLTRQCGMGAQTPPLTMNSPTSATSVNAADKWDRKPVLAKGSMPNLRAASPPPSHNLPAPISGFDFGPSAKSAHLEVEPKSQYGFSDPPLSPPASENDEAAPISQVNDRVKAMMTGAQSKPVQPHDEDRSHQNQFQMNNGRETPPPRKHSPPGPFVPRQQPGPRLRTDSGAQNYAHQRHFPPKDRAPELQSPKQQRIIIPGRDSVSVPFMGSPSRSMASPSKSEFPSKGPVSRPWGLPQPRSFPNLKYRNHNDPLMTPRPDESQHPANQPIALATLGPQQPLPAPPTSSPKILEIKTTPPDDGEREPEPPADSPTLPGLSGMVRSHLRSDSDSSSIYGITASGFNQQISYDPIEETSQDYSERRNPWEINDWDETPISPLAKANAACLEPFAMQPMDSDTEAETIPKAAWEEEMESRHNRDGSSATQQERQEFKEELAQRRKQVQENLKSLVMEAERQPERQVASPTPGSAVLLKTKASLSALAMKQKEAAGQSKAMKMFGIGSSPVIQNGPPQPGKKRTDDSSWKEEEEEMLRNVATSSTPPQLKVSRQARRDAQRDREHQMTMRHQQKGDEAFNEINWSSPRPNEPRQAHPYETRNMQGINDASANFTPRPRAQSRERKPPPVTHSQRNANRESKGSISTSFSGSRPASRTSRDRSGSDASGRSKSRNGRYRDDLAKAMAEGTGSSSQGIVEDLQNARLMLKPTVSSISPGTSPGLPPGISGRPSPIPSPAMGSRPRNNSKAQPSSYFEPQNMHALQTGDALEIGISPRPSPVTPFSVNSTPSLPDQSPIGPRSTTPTASHANGYMTARKKSVTKSEISEPTFISSTSRVSTINLPSGSSLQNGIAPPIPAVNPRRRQTRAMFGAMMGKKDSSEYLERDEIPLSTTSSEEMSTFSDEEETPREKHRQRLRKSLSEGGNLNAEAREKAYNAPSPAMPDFLSGAGGVMGPGPVPAQDGSMF
ncbi:760e9ebc-49c9-41a2-ad3c-e389f9c41721 [Sclerotinia trifoliorum]|uniref:760e9ebc-49c9-41a2-ad3c-e389f9c41721 n=1 Tax=Sclerotinia trifoliorum TaxID=28548 RepID=A0A8H2VMD6_9HELO|nr:760e9ebc-49c9-41a2-ad3c-e389f9c41721 [Sclerotinia trifoliorum]